MLAERIAHADRSAEFVHHERRYTTRERRSRGRRALWASSSRLPARTQPSGGFRRRNRERSSAPHFADPVPGANLLLWWNHLWYCQFQRRRYWDESIAPLF